MPLVSRQTDQSSSAEAQGDRLIARSRPLIVAGAATTAACIALAAQAYLNRRILLGDAGLLFVCAIALFAVAFPRASAQRQPRWLIVAGQVLLVVAALLVFYRAYSDLSNNRNYLQSVILMFAPLLLIGMAYAGSRSSSQPDDEPDSFVHTLWQRVQATQHQISLDGILLAAGALLAIVALAYWFKKSEPNEALALNVLSLLFTGLAVWRLDRGRPTQAAPAARSDAPSRLTELAILAVILGVATFLRTWRLTEIPYGIWFDEGQTGLEAYRIYQGMPFTPMGTFSSANPSLFFYIIAFVFKVMGPTLLAVRLVQAVTGIATVAVFYPFLRSILGWRAAVIGTFLLAVSSWHVNWSRFGMPYSVGAPLFEIITAYLLLRALRSGRLVTFAAAGLAIGLGLYTYFGFRLFPFAILAYLIYALALNKERVRQSIPGLLVFGWVALITVLPLGAWAWQNRADFMARTTQTSVFAGKNTPQERMAALENSLRRHVQMLNYIGDGNGRHGIPGAPAIDFLSGALFVVGLGYALYRWRSPAFMLLVAWFVVTMQAGILSLDWEAPQQHRTLVAIPAIYGLAAIVAGAIWSSWDRLALALSSPPARKAARGLAALVIALSMAAIGYVNYDRYFNLQMGRSDVFYSFSVIETAVARRVAELGVKDYRYFIQVQGAPAFSFLVGGDTPDRPVDNVFFRSYAHMPLREVATKTSVFLLEPWRVTLDPSFVLRYYPNTQFVDHKDPFGKTMVYEFRVPADDVNNLLGLTGRYYAGDKPQGTPLLERVDKTLTFDWRTQPPVEGAFNVEWSGCIIPPDAGVYTLSVTSDGQARISLDGEWLDIGPDKTQVRVDLAKGMHAIVIQFRGRAFNLEWTLPNNQRQPVPTTSLIALGLPENGLLAKYYRSETWQGRPEFIQVDPYLAFRWHPDPIEPGPWSATWTGKIEIPVTGQYMFQGVSNDRFWLIIDGRTYLDGTPSIAEKLIDLTAGRHDIQVKYANNKGYSELRLSWRKPDNTFEVVPTQYLTVK